MERLAGTCALLVESKWRSCRGSQNLSSTAKGPAAALLVHSLASNAGTCRDICAPRLSAALFTTAERQKQPEPWPWFLNGATQHGGHMDATEHHSSLA